MKQIIALFNIVWALLVQPFLSLAIKRSFSIFHSNPNAIISSSQRTTDTCDVLHAKRSSIRISLWGYCASKKSIRLEWSKCFIHFSIHSFFLACFHFWAAASKNWNSEVLKTWNLNFKFMLLTHSPLFCSLIVWLLFRLVIYFNSTHNATHQIHALRSWISLPARLCVINLTTRYRRFDQFSYCFLSFFSYN